LLTLALLFATGRTALAADAMCPATPPDCSDTTEIPNPLVILTADTQESLLKWMGQALRPAGGPHTQMTLVYRNSSSCLNVSTLYDGTMADSGTLSYIPVNAADWDRKTPCTCNVTTPTPFTVASSAIFTESCGLTKPDDVGIFRGPLQGYLFVVRQAATQQATTADEQYFVWGFGDADQVTPWNSEAQLFKRPDDASTLIATMAAVGVPVPKAKGTSYMRSADLITAMTAPTVPDEQALGLLGCAPYDKQRDTTALRALAFKAPQQEFAYFPDSTATSFDKINMREGRYVPWSVTDWLAPVDSTGKIADPNAAYLINLILDQPVDPAPAFDPLTSVMGGGLVPACAMRVMRDMEAGPLSVYDSPTPCHCAFDMMFAPDQAASCVACDESTPCATGTCRHGFCEAK
jgi:hypothetical protein